MKLFKRYLFVILMVALTAAVYAINRDIGLKAVRTTLFSFKEMLLIIPPIFVLLGLLDVWVSRETMVRFLGEGSGLKGMMISIFIGAAAAGPLYAAFPVALVFMKKGAKFSNVLLFIGAWSTAKIPMILFELSSMGPVFTFTRLSLSLASIFIIAFIVEKLMTRQEIEDLYAKAASKT